MKSWYDLNDNEVKKLEQEFIDSHQGHKEHNAMYICVTSGVVIAIVSTIYLGVYLMYSLNPNPYIFIISLLFIIVGTLMVYLATIEYHKKYNSYLEIKHKIIRK